MSRLVWTWLSGTRLCGTWLSGTAARIVLRSSTRSFALTLATLTALL